MYSVVFLSMDWEYRWVPRVGIRLRNDELEGPGIGVRGKWSREWTG